MAANMGILEPEQKEALEKNRVEVFIWMSDQNAGRSGSNVGHIALSVNRKGVNHYFSLWPEVPPSETFGEVKPSFPKQLETDCKYEERAPDFMFCFYYLKTKPMVEEIERLKRERPPWTLLGSFQEKCESCASSAWKILVAGGINEFISGAAAAHTRESSKASSRSRPFISTEHVVTLMDIKSPDGLATELKLAKESELKKHPEIEEMNFVISPKLEGEIFEIQEYNPNEESRKISSKPGCRMM